MTREGIIHGVEPINYQRMQPPANKTDREIEGIPGDFSCLQLTVEGIEVMPTSVRSIERFLQEFSKLKDFQLKLHIKDDVTPVAQPVRRLPFGLRAKVDEK